MTRELKIFLRMFIILLSAFILVTLVSEYINIENLKLEYDLSDEIINYRKDSLVVWTIGRILHYLIPLFLIASRIGYRIDFEINIKSDIIKGFIYGLIIFCIIFIIKLPLRYYGSYILAHRYGISNQSFIRWITKNLKNFLLNDFLIAMILFFPYGLMKKNSKNWWFKMGIIFIIANIIINIIYPVVITPIFNDFRELEEGSLKVNIEKLMIKAGIENGKVLVVDKSKDTRAMNAYMTGIYNSKRIVLWDNTINNLEEDEVLSIVAHEIGHYKENHILKSVISSSFVILFGMFILDFLVKWIIKNSNSIFGFRNIYNYSTLPIFILIINILLGLNTPVNSYISRIREREADYYQIILTEDRQAAVSSMKKIYSGNLSLPRKGIVFEFIYGTHPNLEDRLNFYENVEI